MIDFSRIKSLQSMQKVLWLIYWHSQNPLKVRQVARHHLMRMPSVWHKPAWKPATKVGVEVRVVGRELGRWHIHTHHLFLMSAFCRGAAQKPLPLGLENSLGTVRMLQMEVAASRRSSSIMQVVYELRWVSFGGEHQKRMGSDSDSVFYYLLKLKSIWKRP